MKNIVIIGAGFAGITLALNLEKRYGGSKEVAITLVDKHDYHLFTPNLYEAATTEEEIISVQQVKKSITVPLSKVLQGKKIHLVKAELKGIDIAQKKIITGNKKIDYDYLVLALGSQSDFFNIEGAQKFALTLKDLPDALRVRNQISFAMESHRLDSSKKNIRLVVAGGGYTGLEVAAELKGLVDFLVWKNEYPREKVEIEIIEGLNKLVSGFDDRLSEDALNRIRDLGIHVRLSSKITKVDEHFIELMTGEKISYDVIVWSAGVRGPAITSFLNLSPDPRNRLPVNNLFQVQGQDSIFAIGDTSSIMGSNGRPVPSTAQDAIEQGRYLAYAFPYIIKNRKPPKAYQNTSHGFIVSLGGKWSILDSAPFYFKGYLAYLAHLFAHFRYYLSIVGFWKAIKWVIFEAEVYGKND